MKVKINPFGKKIAKRLSAAAAAMFVLLGAGAVPSKVQAENIPPTKNLTKTFNKYLVMDEEANVPNVGFTFSIAAGAAVAANGSRVVYAGNDPDRVEGSPVLAENGEVIFQATDEAYTNPQGTDTVELNNGKKYAKKTVTVDFRGVKFKSPGIYRYVITENKTLSSGINNDSTATRTLDVFVEYAENPENQLIVSSYILYPGTKTDSADASSKDDGFTNTYTTQNLTLSKQVAGNQGDRDKYFEFTVKITGAVAGTVYSVDTSKGSGTTENTNPTSLTATTDGTVTATFYLKHNESIVIQGLTADTKYKITEENYSTDGYTTSNDKNQTDGNTTGEQTMGVADQTVTFTNKKQGTVPTGILLETAPYIVLAAVVIAGLAVLLITRRRHSR